LATGHGQKLSRLQERAVAALLTEGTLERAAAAVGCDAKTLSRWLRRPAFRSAFHEARRRVLDDAITLLQRLCTRAVARLNANLDAPRAADSTRAAEVILNLAIRGVELMDLAVEVERLKRLVSGEGGDDGDGPAADRDGPDDGPGPPGPPPDDGGPPGPAAGGPGDDLHPGGPEPGPVAGAGAAEPLLADAAPLFPPVG
jgi:hypothetical protein